jgi:hypothetical protein
MLVEIKLKVILSEHVLASITKLREDSLSSLLGSFNCFKLFIVLFIHLLFVVLLSLQELIEASILLLSRERCQFECLNRISDFSTVLGVQRLNQQLGVHLGLLYLLLDIAFSAFFLVSEDLAVKEFLVGLENVCRLHRTTSLGAEETFDHHSFLYAKS